MFFMKDKAKVTQWFIETGNVCDQTFAKGTQSTSYDVSLYIGDGYYDTLFPTNV